MKELTNNNLTSFKWTLFTTIGWLLGFILALLVAHPLEEIKLTIFGIGLGISLGIGLMQWLTLRKHIAYSSHWITYSILGFGGVFLFLNIIQLALETFSIKFMTDGFSFLIPTIIGASLGGYLNGLLQERYMLKKLYNQKTNWAITSFIAWLTASVILGVYIAITMEGSFNKTSIGPLPTLIVFFSVGPIVGIFTGKKIVSIIHRKL